MSTQIWMQPRLVVRSTTAGAREAEHVMEKEACVRCVIPPAPGRETFGSTTAQSPEPGGSPAPRFNRTLRPLLRARELAGQRRRAGAGRLARRGRRPQGASQRRPPRVRHRLFWLERGGEGAGLRRSGAVPLPVGIMAGADPEKVRPTCRTWWEEGLPLSMLTPTICQLK